MGRPQFWRTMLSVLLFALGLIIITWGSQELLLMTEVPLCVYPVDEIKEDAAASILGQIQVEINGAVKKPGIYAISSTDRLGDLIELAEGLHADADREYVQNKLNLAERLQDELKIYIPYRQERELSAAVDTYCSISESDRTNRTFMQTKMSEPEQDKVETVGTERETESEIIGEKSELNLVNQSDCISINQANANELQELPGVGEKRATDIIQNRPFNTIDDLLSVSGIGESTLNSIRELICL